MSEAPPAAVSSTECCDAAIAPNFLFKIENGLANRWLGHVQAPGGFAVVQMMSDADEVTSMAKLHNFVLIAESDYYRKIIRFQRLPMPCDTRGK